jgi:hypothetical protein
MVVQQLNFLHLEKNDLTKKANENSSAKMSLKFELG